MNGKSANKKKKKKHEWEEHECNLKGLSFCIEMC